MSTLPGTVLDARGTDMSVPSPNEAYILVACKPINKIIWNTDKEYDDSKMR